MLIRPVSEMLAPVGLISTELSALIPNESNYKALLMQPRGEIEANATGVRNRDRDLARQQFRAFLDAARETDADLVVTPEYSMPWETLVDALKAGVVPAEGKLWALGCESIRYSELESLKQNLAMVATMIYEPLQASPAQFLDPLVYVFVARQTEAGGMPKIVLLVQFKTYPMGDNDHFEINGLQRGTYVYFFTNAGQSLRLLSLICSDTLDFPHQNAAALYDRTLFIHIQLTPKPRQAQFRMYRDRLLSFSGDATEILCLNWAEKVTIWANGTPIPWNNISASAWYVKSERFDDSDSTLSANHRRGLYYTWLEESYTHALFFNFDAATYLVTASKVAHIGVPAAMSRRRGPQLTKTLVWNSGPSAWIERTDVLDGFSDIVAASGGASAEIKRIADANPLSAERVLALCAGKIGQENWHKVRQLDSCNLGEAEVIRRITFCQDTNQAANEFRLARLRRCGHLWDILTDGSKLPPALADFRDGFSFEWSQGFPHQNAKSSTGRRATVIYMGEESTKTHMDQIAKTAAECLRRTLPDPRESRAARQRLAIWFRQNEEIGLSDPHRYVQIDQPGDTSEFDIGKES